jgi:hypothetical protein
MNLYAVIFLLCWTVLATYFWLRAWRDDRDPAPPILTLIAFAVAYGLGFAAGWQGAYASLMQQLAALQ